MTSFSALERARLADALAATDPDAPTLCEGWTARDLAAHLVVRERRPDTTPGLMLRPLAGWTDRVRRGYAQRPYAGPDPADPHGSAADQSVRPAGRGLRREPRRTLRALRGRAPRGAVPRPPHSSPTGCRTSSGAG